MRVKAGRGERKAGEVGDGTAYWKTVSSWLARVERARQIVRSMFWLTKRAEPSAIPTLTPPVSKHVGFRQVSADRGPDV